MTRKTVLAGVFVGGASSRMGSPKGLLPFRGQTLLGRWLALFARLEVPVVLVGARPEYGHFGVATLRDEPADVGPAGGLAALLSAADERQRHYALAVACDMPFVTDALVERLLESESAPVVSARREGRWEPFFARYDASLVRPILAARLASGRRNLQGLLTEAPAVELPMTPEEHGMLRDWDSPSDMQKDVSP